MHKHFALIRIICYSVVAVVGLLAWAKGDGPWAFIAAMVSFNFCIEILINKNE